MGNSRDHALVERCKKGDRQALEALVREYQRPVYNVAYRILGNPDDAADITQAAFLKAFENLESYDSNYKFFSWIYRIAINESINQSRRASREQFLDDEEIPSELGPERDAEAGDLSRGIQAGLMVLSEDYRTVIVLRHFSDFSYRQISQVLQIPEKTVKSRLYSARQLMKDHLLENDIRL